MRSSPPVVDAPREAIPSPAGPSGEGRPEPPLGATGRGVRWALVAILAYALAARLLIAVTVPPWQGPDEPKHFEASRVVLDDRARWWAERRLPGEADESIPLQSEIIASLARHGGWTYAGQRTPDVLPASFFEMWPGKSTQLARPSLYVVLGAFALLPAEGASIERQLLALRLLSVALSTAAVALTYLAARAVVASDPRLALIAAAFAAALPMHVFVGGTANSDNLATLLGSAAAAAILGALRERAAVRLWLAAAAAVGLALVTKRAAAGLLPAVLVAGGWSVAAALRPPGRAGRRRTRPVLVAAAATVAVATLLLVWIGGWLMSAVPDGLLAYVFNEPEHPGVFARLAFRSPELRELALWHLGWLVWSFWGVFGWWTVHLPAGLYRALSVVTALGAAGFVLSAGRSAVAWLRRGDAAAHVRTRQAAFILLAVGGVAVLAIAERLVYMNRAEVPQGRYLFAAIAPIAILHVAGLAALLPSHVRASAPPAVLAVAALIALDAVVYLGYLAPFYAPR